jgi:shikimate dehydrogenase
MVYEAIDGGAGRGRLRARAWQAFRAAGGRGMNVTLPFKLAALAAADERQRRTRAWPARPTR